MPARMQCVREDLEAVDEAWTAQQAITRNSACQSRISDHVRR
jgi:hypothetical protein